MANGRDTLLHEWRTPNALGSKRRASRMKRSRAMERLIILQALAAAALLTGRAAAAPNDVRTYSGPQEYSRACILKLKNMGLAYHRPKCSVVETREFFIVAIPGENGTSRCSVLLCGG